MRKLNYFLGMLLMGITTWVNAQEAEPIEWNGASLQVTLSAGEARTYSYTAENNGILYIYSTSENELPVSISGGWWHDGAYDEDAQLEDAGDYNNGYGVYGHIKVWEGDQVRFTLKASDNGGAGGTTSLTLKSLFFNQAEWSNGFYWKGQNWENPVELAKDKKVTLPVYANNDTDTFNGYSHLTFCSFTAPTDGTASIQTTTYQILYQEEDLIETGTFKNVIEGSTQYMHDFVVKQGKTYIIAVPITRPDDVTVTMTADRSGATCADPVEILAGTPSYDLVKGHNWFLLDVSALGTDHIMDLGVTASWNGTVSYWMNCQNQQEGLGADAVSGQAAVFHKNLDPDFTNNTGFLYIDVYLDDQDKAENGVSFSLREPLDGETCSMAIPAEAGTNDIKGDARDYWFSYTPAKDCNIALSATGAEILYFLPYCGSSNNADIYGNHQYRVYADQTVYIGIRKSGAADGTLAITESDIVPGVNCDIPIDFALGEDISISDRTTADAILATTYLRFTAEESGYAIVETTCTGWIENYWTANFRTTCHGTVLPKDLSEFRDATGKLGFRYKVAVSAGVTYIFDLTNGSNGQADINISTRFEEAEEGGTCETAIAITELGKDIAIPGQANYTVWYTYTADKSGTYTVTGCVRGTKTYQIGDCSAKATTLATNWDDNGYMKGLIEDEFYVEAGTPFFIYIKTNNTPYNDGNREYPFYINVSFSGDEPYEPLPGETFANAIEAKPDVAYEMATGDDAYETWYWYAIPAGHEQVIEFNGTSPIYFNQLYFYADEDTELSAYRKDYTDEQVKNDAGQIVGRKYTFPVMESERTIYIVASVPTVDGITMVIRSEGNAIQEASALAPTMLVTPNPNDGAFSVSLPEVSAGAYVSICNMSGAEVYRERLTNTVTHINLSGRLGAGMYLVTVNNGGIATAKMLVK